MYWNEYKTNNEIKSTTKEYRYLSNFTGVNRSFSLVCLNRDNNVKRFKAQGDCLTKGIIKNSNVIINRKNFYNQPIDSDKLRDEEMRKLTTGQGEDYTTVYLLDYEYIKNHYRLIAVDLIRQKKLDADPKAIQQIEFVGQLENNEGKNAHGAQSFFFF